MIFSSLFRRRRQPVEEIDSLYDDYRDARDEVWRILAENEVNQLPVDVLALCDAENVEVYSYSHAQVLIDSLHLLSVCRQDESVVLSLADRKVILIKDSLPLSYQRFLIAHGFAHFVLAHKNLNTDSQNHVLMFSDDDNLQAGIFAVRLLAPLSVLFGLGVSNAGEIERVCCIPKQTADKRLQRLQEIENRNLERGIKTGQGSLFVSGYERAAYRNFSDYIENYRQMSL